MEYFLAYFGELEILVSLLSITWNGRDVKANRAPVFPASRADYGMLNGSDAMNDLT